MLDARGVPVSGADNTALNDYESAVSAFQRFSEDPVEPLTRALERCPDFTAAHLLLAVVFALATEKRFAPAVRDALDKARNAPRNKREQGLLEAMDLLTAGNWERAARRLDAVLVDYPTDIVSLQAGHLLDFFCGDAINLRNRILRVLPDWAPELPRAGYVHGMLAFGLEECNQYAEAEAAAMTALDAEPDDAWATHAATHVNEMRGDLDKGIRFLEERQRLWARGSGLAVHTWWHLGLLYLDKGQPDRTLSLLDEQIMPTLSDLSIDLLDVASMLWRLQLLAIDVGPRMQEHATLWHDKLALEPGHYGFNDLHAAAAFAGAGDVAALTQLRTGAEQALEVAAAGYPRRAATAGLALVAGFQAFAEERYEEAAETLAAARETAPAVGGSHAQRDLITWTLIVAARRAGNHRLADSYLRERVALRPEGFIAAGLAA